jgi:hypothetical protein
MSNHRCNACLKLAARDAQLTKHERFWIEVIREAARDSDPPPSLRRVQELRRIFREAGPQEEPRRE